MPDKQYRSFATFQHDPETKRLNSNYYIEGYAAKFERYLWYEYDGVRYYEEIAPNAFDNADMSDVIMQYDHGGKVLARTKNNSLGLEVDNIGLFVYADLSKSNAAKELYGEVAEGLVDKMSWAFNVAKRSVERLSDKEYLYRIDEVGKVYDVSAVSLPANNDTAINARNKEAALWAEHCNTEGLDLKARRLALKIKTSR